MEPKQFFDTGPPANTVHLDGAANSARLGTNAQHGPTPAMTTTAVTDRTATKLPVDR